MKMTETPRTEKADDPTLAFSVRHRNLRDLAEKLEKELAALKADAERFRWLRDHLHTGDEDNLPPMIYINDGGRYGEPTRDTLDAAIDAELSKERGHE